MLNNPGGIKSLHLAKEFTAATHIMQRSLNELSTLLFIDTSHQRTNMAQGRF